MTRAALALTLSAAAGRAQETIRICAGGDVTLGVNGDTIVRNGRRVPPPSWPLPSALLAPLQPLFGDADIVLLNLEGAIGDGPADKCAARGKNCFALRMPATAAEALRGLNPRATVVANVANNHAHDAGEDGFAQSLRRLGEAGVLVTGADSEPTIAVTARGDTVAFLGFSASAPLDVHDLDLVRRLVARAVAITPRVVVTMHLGAEGPGAQRTRDASEKFVGEDRGDPVAFARAAVESGAMLVVGHGPHVVRGVRWIGSGLVFYSLGNLVTAGPFSLHPPNDRGLVACADLAPSGKVTGAILRPTRQRGAGNVSADPTGRAIILADSLSRLDFRDSAAKFRVEAAISPP
jgi:poly-gamma-glutamate capsule biosynthesis protein CapA/YwtB (metallophosphatase superfamily)